MGTGRSFIIPTSTGQDPGAAEMVTRRVGTCRVSPCTHVMGSRDLVSLRGGRICAWTRLTALPESNNALNGRPLIFVIASGAPVGRSWCRTQPASHVRAWGEGGAVGIDSSGGLGPAVLSICREMPSGTRCSGTTLRGKGGARSPASRRWAASASSIASTNSSVVVGFRIPTACRWVRGRARRRRSITTRSVTWAAVDAPSMSQCWARSESLAAWACAGRRGWYTHSWKHWAAHTGDSPTRARISLLMSS